MTSPREKSDLVVSPVGDRDGRDKTNFSLPAASELPALEAVRAGLRVGTPRDVDGSSEPSTPSCDGVVQLGVVGAELDRGRPDAIGDGNPMPAFLTTWTSAVACATPGTRFPPDPLKVCATGALVALLLAFVLAVHDRGGTTYDGCPVPDDSTTCPEAHR